METANGRGIIEEALFGQTGANNEVVKTRVPKSEAPGWTSSASAYISKLNSTQKVGPNQLLKVMAGDQLSTYTEYYYHQNATNTSGSTVFSSVTDMLKNIILSSAASPGSIKNDNIATAITGAFNTGTPFSQLISPDITNSGGIIPKAYLNIVFFDERFRFVEESSTSLRVGSQGASTLALTNIKAPKNGYCFAYISNESSINVFFDNFKVRHDRGRIIEENHYYAYGLKIAPLSSKAYGAPNNNYTYQGDYNEFDDDLGWHDFALRSYDPQTGRFLQSDPYEQFSSGYIGMGNDPANMIDPSGGWGTPSDGPGKLYGSRDGAAWGWARFYGRQSLMQNVEISSVIYEVSCCGAKYYSFTVGALSPIRELQEIKSPGIQHYLERYKKSNGIWDVSHLVPKGSDIVGHIHSHPDENGRKRNVKQSEGDEDEYKRFNEKGYNFYLFNYRSQLRRIEVIDKPNEKTVFDPVDIVEGLFCGTNCDKSTDNGNGKKTGKFNSEGREIYPRKDIMFMGNSKVSGFVSGIQITNMAINLVRTVMGLSSTSFSGIQSLFKVGSSLPCPIF